MVWITIGTVVVILFILFLVLYFRSSGALSIVEEEQEEISHESPEQLAQELRDVQLQDAEALRVEEDEFHSHG
jgi:hypothetical protein